MKKNILFLIVVCMLLSSITYGSDKLENTTKIEKIDEYVKDNFKELKVPGMSMGIIINGEEYYLNYGVSDISTNKDVNNKTSYEIGSLTKSFTGLAIAKLVDEGEINISDKVSKYIPEFHGIFNNKKYDITIENLLYHTSGIGVETLVLYREDDSEDALLKISQKLSGVELSGKPGSQYEYATINYAVLGAIIEIVTGESYKEYIEENILKELDMTNSYVGYKEGDKELSKGYKISFFKPREYSAPKFRNNYPAGYIISNTKDMIKYLDFQLGNTENALYKLREITHKSNTKVPYSQGSFYTYGWVDMLNGFDELNHVGNNPNFTSLASFNKELNSGIVVLSNSNSSNVHELANNIAKFIYGKETLNNVQMKAGGMDNALSGFAILFAGIILVLIGLWIYIVYEYKKGKRNFGFEKSAIKKLIIYLLSTLPILYGMYLLPKVFGQLDWYTVQVWASQSLILCIGMIIGSVTLSYITYTIILLFPTKNQYLKEAPELILLGILSGMANAIVIFLVTSSLNNEGDMKYLVYYFLTALYVYVVARRTLEVKLLALSQLIIRNIRENIFSKLLSANFEEFEDMDSGQVTATMTNDINQIGNIAGVIIVLVTYMITILAALVYLATISLFGTLAIIGVIIATGSLYAYLSNIAAKHLDVARDTQNEFLARVEGLIGGFKDLVLHKGKRKEYKIEASEINSEFQYNNVQAFKAFVNAFMLGESVFIIVLGTTAFGFALFFSEFSKQELASFVVILIYILGPIATIINEIPRAIQIRIAIDRVKRLIKQLPTRTKTKVIEIDNTSKTIESFKAEGISFQYKESSNGSGFKVGPIDLEVKKGEILFIIGGNGSGKSTLMKLISGLYDLHGGSIKVNEKIMKSSEIGEHISAVFTDSYMFKKIYDVDLSQKEEKVSDYLKMLGIDEKVQLVDNAFTTVSLSTGQRKRLHLLRCLLEDKPIYLFDELAADQDPQFRNFFYRTILPKMKAEGKIVIAVTHDDHYFDVADRALKLYHGQIEDITTDDTEASKEKVSQK